MSNITPTTATLVAKIAADVIRDAVLSERSIPERVQDEVRASGLDASAVRDSAVEAAVHEITTQDPLWKSKRVWSVVSAVVTAVLMVPEVQGLLGEWAPAVTAVLAALLGAWSKQTDIRPYA